MNKTDNSTTDSDGIANYVGHLGDSVGHCLSIGLESYSIDTVRLAERAGVDPNKLEESDYYMIRGVPGFTTERISRAHKIDLGAKTVDLEFSLGSGGICKDTFPTRDEEQSSKHVKCEYGATVKPQGEIQFGLLKGSVEGEAGWHKVTNFVVSTINTYCYSVGALTPTPAWVFQTRQGENHLSAQREREREIGLALQIPKGKMVSGSLKMSCRDLVLLDADHHELSRFKKFVTRITTRIKSDPYYTPLTINFPPAANSLMNQFMITTNRDIPALDLDAPRVIRAYGQLSNTHGFLLAREPLSSEGEKVFELEEGDPDEALPTKHVPSKPRKKRETTQGAAVKRKNLKREPQSPIKGGDTLRLPFTAPTVRFIEKELARAKLSGEL